NEKKTSATEKKKRKKKIKIRNPDASSWHPRTPPNTRPLHGSWSSAEKKVFFWADDDGHPPQKNNTKIYCIDVKSERVKTLISGGVNTYTLWSPDMKEIVFRRIIGDMNSEIFVARVYVTNLRNITNNPSFDVWASWSLHGT